ncbi:carboxypeptidase regulatory-like domain-containing protein [Carboxylicivirga sediminis]|uniref:Carboxypeptidase regulatory-like domain-containing protein n=1 Tax=Carboxylicivirga sediminis TaxID=2006564 RepID=A0A941IXK1_9BACT|nr:carboxypeptidase regulatory-like domain-containing protein [Carboxylicivirga sediminis]MBR8535678.1 carboxypeptidase regulatory-like domain-containing protein [Carboxylicivirga sediminis]
MIRYISLKLVAFSLLLVVSSCEDAVVSDNYGTITGIIESKVNGMPLEGALISTNPASRSIKTDADGRFTLDELEAGDYVVTASKHEYANGSSAVNVRKDKVTDIVIQLEDGDLAANTVKFSSPMPSPNQEDVGVPITFSWAYTGVSDSSDISFELEVRTPESVEPVIFVEDLVDTFYVAQNLSYSKNHTWTVIAKKNDEKIGQSDFWNFRTVSSASLPFMFVEPDDAHIYLSAGKDGTKHRMTQETILNNFPRANPVTDEVIFSASYNSKNHIYLTYGEDRVTDVISPLPVDGNHHSGEGFCWSPTGDQVLFCHYDKLYRINKDGSGLFTVSTAPAGRNYVFVDWSGIAGKIVVQTRGVNIYDSEIYLMNPDGSGMTRIVDNANGRTEYPTFSIDGKLVVYTHDNANVNDPYGRMYDSRIYTYNISSTAVTDISGNGKPDGTNDIQPRISPDGSKIIFVNTSNTGTGQKDIYVMDVNGGNRELYFENAEMPEWR